MPPSCAPSFLQVDGPELHRDEIVITRQCKEAARKRRAAAKDGQNKCTFRGISLPLEGLVDNQALHQIIPILLFVAGYPHGNELLVILIPPHHTGALHARSASFCALQRD